MPISRRFTTHLSKMNIRRCIPYHHNFTAIDTQLFTQKRAIVRVRLWTCVLIVTTHRHVDEIQNPQSSQWCQCTYSVKYRVGRRWCIGDCDWLPPQWWWSMARFATAPTLQPLDSIAARSTYESHSKFLRPTRLEGGDHQLNWSTKNR